MKVYQNDVFYERAAIASLAVEREISFSEARAAWRDMAPTLKDTRRDRLRLIGRYLAACGVASFLASCASAPRERIVYQTVEVPVAARCTVDVERPDLPATPEAIKAAPDIEALARLYRADWLLTRPYMAALEAALSGCR